MPTTKKRIHITLPENLENSLVYVCKRDNVSLSTKAVELLENALELDEDDALQAIAEKRDTPHTTFVSHEEAWA